MIELLKVKGGALAGEARGKIKCTEAPPKGGVARESGEEGAV
jgi:hypothetical protein